MKGIFILILVIPATILDIILLFSGNYLPFFFISLWLFFEWAEILSKK